MKKYFLIIFLILVIFICPNTVQTYEYGYTKSGFKYAKHNHSESSYQHAWCSMHRGIEEYENNDCTRVDCLTDDHAVEFDFANKWAESVGQAEHYALKTGKKGMVVLILENPKTQMVYYNRVKTLGKKYGFDTEYITPQILHPNNNGQCVYSDCKCHKQTKIRKS